MAEGVGTDARRNQRGLTWDLNNLLCRGMPPFHSHSSLKCRFQDPRGCPEVPRGKRVIYRTLLLPFPGHEWRGWGSGAAAGRQR